MSIEFKCTEIVSLPISELQEHPDNNECHPHDEQLIKDLAFIFKSAQGFNVPIKINKNININKELDLPIDKYIISSGHARVKALKFAGESHVPCIPIHYKNSDVLFADLIADNATNERRTIAKEAVSYKLKNLDGLNFDLKLLGFKEFLVEPMELHQDHEKQDVLHNQCPNCNHKW